MAAASLKKRLTANVPEPSGEFGWGVAVDGDLIAVANNDGPGAVHLYRRGANNWLLEDVLTPPSGKTFGKGVEVRGDHVFVGEVLGHSVHVFHHDGASWSEVQVLDPDYMGFGGSRFGERMEVSGDLLVVGDFTMDDTPGRSGGAIVYRWTGSSWKFHTRICPEPTSDPHPWVGEDVAISGDRVVLNAPLSDLSLPDAVGRVLVTRIPPSIGTLSCGPAVPNSSGKPARLLMSGEAEVAEGCLRLDAIDLPVGSVTGIFLASQTPGHIPNPGGSSGDLCLTGQVLRFLAPAGAWSGAEAISATIDPGALPAPHGGSIQPGETWYFQAWYRDLPGQTSNFSSAVSVTFQ